MTEKEKLIELRQIAAAILSGTINADPIHAYKPQRYADAIVMAREFQGLMDKEFGE